MALTVHEALLIFILPLALLVLVALIVWVVYSFIPQFPSLPEIPDIPWPTIPDIPFPQPTPQPTPPLNPVMEFTTKDLRIISTDPQTIQDITRTGNFLVTLEAGGKIGLYGITGESCPTASTAFPENTAKNATDNLKVQTISGLFPGRRGQETSSRSPTTSAGSWTSKSQPQVLAEFITYHMNKVNDPIIQLAGFGKTIIGLTASGLLVRLKGKIMSSEWTWKILKVTPGDVPVTYINATLNGDYLWITTAANSYLLNHHLDVVRAWDTVEKRVYGSCPEAYILPTGQGSIRVYPSGEDFTEVSYAALNTSDMLITTNIQQGTVLSGLRAVGESVYYLFKGQMGGLGIPATAQVTMNQANPPMMQVSPRGDYPSNVRANGAALLTLRRAAQMA